MKYLIPLFFCLNSFAQKSEVIEDSTIKKNEAFSKSLEWVAKTWKSANHVIDMKDESAGTIVVKGGLESKPKALGMPVKGMSMSTLTIRVKDGKAKIEFSDTYFKWDSGPIWTIAEPKSAGQYTKWSDSTLKEIDDMIADYKKALKGSSDF